MDNEYNRYYIKIRTILGINPKTIHEELAIALGSKAPSYPTVAEWAKRFREGREDANDDPRSGRPVSELTDENIELVQEVINNDLHSTDDDIIAETFLSHGTIERIIHGCLKMKKITSRWIQRKSTNASWVGEDESPTTIVRRGKFEPKNLFFIFFKSNGPVFMHAVDEGKTIDHNYYIENCLKPVVKEIWKQRKSAGTKGIKLPQDNARPHIHSDVINYLTEEGIITMSHPPYSPDLAPCDY
ncbi:unnamed protein product [Rotaria sp. Silwood2]|nr:unnamed protein product [Rotaria sp. Silwood2]CAF4309744.1 unnamed protein product [Rotaria sp. Silwood2]